jgi:hypothetical protein
MAGARSQPGQPSDFQTAKNCRSSSRTVDASGRPGRIASRPWVQTITEGENNESLGAQSREDGCQRPQGELNNRRQLVEGRM